MRNNAIFRAMVAALSLTASTSCDERRKKILDQARAVWGIKNLLGINFDGCDKEVISKIAEIEKEEARLDMEELNPIH